jgi:hypothetical protein
MGNLPHQMVVWQDSPECGRLGQSDSGCDMIGEYQSPFASWVVANELARSRSFAKPVGVITSTKSKAGPLRPDPVAQTFCLPYRRLAACTGLGVERLQTPEVGLCP